MKYKPWKICPSNCWNDEPETDGMFVEKWKQFLQSKKGKTLVPDWQRLLNDASIYTQSPNENSDDEEWEAPISEESEEWMHLARLTAPTTTNSCSVQEIEQMRSSYTQPQINELAFWLEQTKKETTATTTIPICSPDLLNEKQEVVYNLIQNHFTSNEQVDQINLIVTGQGGSGKSFLISALRTLLGDTCIVAAYFGIAAHNINGVTLHSLLQLPIRGRNNCDLKGMALSKLQHKMSHVKYLIIDEFSVIGQKLLGWIDRRLRQASGLMNKTFGGYNVILVGDIAQLPPVADKCLYHQLPDGSTALMGFCAYYNIKNVVKLENNVRASGKNDESFRNLLLRLRNGLSTTEDWKMLSMQNVPPVYYNANMPVKLAFSNEVVANFNLELLQSLKKSIYPIKAKHNNSKAAKISSEEYGGLDPLIHLAVGAKVMLTRNLWVENGLCNGSMGVLHKLIYQRDQTPPLIPIAAMVKFENYKGPTFYNSGLVPIVPVLSICDSSYERQQIPLKLSWSITIHKSQGLTLDKAIIDLGKSERVAGLACVAISRVLRLSDLYMIPTTHERLLAVAKTCNFKYRISEENRLDKLDSQTCNPPYT